MTEGITGITSRIAAIQADLSSLSTRFGSTTVAGTSFAQALAAQLGSASTSTSTTTTTTSTTAAAAVDSTRNADGIPTALAAYGNGKIPADALQQVGTTSHRLWAPAASALTQLIADAKAQGVTIGITDSYRSYASQVDVAARKGLYSEGGLAAVPGTSDHGWGMAADLDLDSSAQAWMRANAGRYGFVEDTPREPWHWAYTN
ncbi:M15 family metallopeptidase [Cellulomonas sp. RIT-PI-Y]|uniref:M15 family metallopeptidase n=1 Tax=Cellulomonas sp. RIT-PI-Y TaxID=3035297 RepID=UPI0021DB5BDB|nr:M15 family metallopeptidase [Cellulomonas sp. RIT-PI-Y]